MCDGNAMLSNVQCESLPFSFDESKSNPEGQHPAPELTELTVADSGTGADWSASEKLVDEL